MTQRKQNKRVINFFGYLQHLAGSSESYFHVFKYSHTTLPQLESFSTIVEDLVLLHQNLLTALLLVRLVFNIQYCIQYLHY